MLLEIIEPDEKFVKDFSVYLTEKFGAKFQSPRLFEIFDTFSFDQFHGLRVYAGKSFLDDFLEAGKWLNSYTGNFDFYVNLKRQYHKIGILSPKQVESIQKAIEREKPQPGWLEQHADVVKWLNSYQGDFPFYVSLQMQFRQRAMLSPKQVESVRKAIARDEVRANPVTTPGQVFSIKPGEIYRVAKWFAKQLGRQAGLARAHYLVEVVAVFKETEKAYNATLKLSGERSTHCSICGLALTNKVSKAAGIGPICAGNIGIDQEALAAGRALDVLASQLKETKQVTTWFPKSVLKKIGER